MRKMDCQLCSIECHLRSVGDRGLLRQLNVFESQQVDGRQSQILICCSSPLRGWFLHREQWSESLIYLLKNQRTKIPRICFCSLKFCKLVTCNTAATSEWIKLKRVVCSGPELHKPHRGQRGRAVVHWLKGLQCNRQPIASIPLSSNLKGMSYIPTERLNTKQI